MDSRRNTQDDQLVYTPQAWAKTQKRLRSWNRSPKSLSIHINQKPQLEALHHHEKSIRTSGIWFRLDLGSSWTQNLDNGQVSTFKIMCVSTKICLQNKSRRLLQARTRKQNHKIWVGSNGCGVQERTRRVQGSSLVWAQQEAANFTVTPYGDQENLDIYSEGWFPHLSDSVMTIHNLWTFKLIFKSRSRSACEEEVTVRK